MPLFTSSYTDSPTLSLSSKPRNMSARACRRVSFCVPETSEKPQLRSEVASDPKARILRGGFRQRSDYQREIGFMSQLKAKLTRALCFACLASVGNIKRRRRSSRRVCSSSLARSRSYAEPSIDSHRAEAVEDCIEFLNASSFSNFQRSSSVR